MSAQYDKKENYLQGFLKKRLTALLLPYLLATLPALVLTAAWEVHRGHNTLPLLALRFFQMLLAGDTVLPFSWYVTILALLYLVFYMVYRFAGRKRGLRFVLLSAGLGAIMGLCAFLGYGSYWYDSILAFLLGVAYYRFSKSWGIALSGILLAAAFGGAVHTNKNLILAELSACICPVFLFQCARALRFQSKILDYLGSRSYALYLCQGFPVISLEKLGVNQHAVVYFFAVMIITLVLAEALHRLTGRILAGSIFDSNKT